MFTPGDGMDSQLGFGEHMFRLDASHDILADKDDYLEFADTLAGG